MIFHLRCACVVTFYESTDNVIPFECALFWHLPTCINLLIFFLPIRCFLHIHSSEPFLSTVLVKTRCKHTIYSYSSFYSCYSLSFILSVYVSPSFLPQYQTQAQKKFSSKVEWQNDLKLKRPAKKNDKNEEEEEKARKKTTEKKRARNCTMAYSADCIPLLSFVPIHCFTADAQAHSVVSHSWDMNGE